MAFSGRDVLNSTLMPVSKWVFAARFNKLFTQVEPVADLLLRASSSAYGGGGT